MKYMAHIVDGKVVSVSIWDGESPWSPAEDVVEIPQAMLIVNPETGEEQLRPIAGAGWDYVDGEFVDNRPVEESS